MRAQPLTGLKTAFVALAFICGCARQPPADTDKNVSVAKLLQGQVEQATKQLELATQQLQAAQQRIASLEKDLAEATDFAADTLVKAEQNEERYKAEIAAAQEKIVVAQRELNLRRSIEAQENSRYRAEGTWQVTDGKTRFLFLDDGTGVIQQRDKDGQWISGFECSEQFYKCDGAFKFHMTLSRGIYKLTYTEAPGGYWYELHQKSLDHSEAMNEKYPAARIPVRRKEYRPKEVTATFALETTDKARIIGWREQDTLLERLPPE